MIINVSILLDDECSKSAHIPIEGIHTESVYKVMELSVCEVYNTLSEIASDAFQLIFFGCRGGGEVYLCIYLCICLFIFLFIFLYLCVTFCYKVVTL